MMVRSQPGDLTMHGRAHLVAGAVDAPTEHDPVREEYDCCVEEEYDDCSSTMRTEDEDTAESDCDCESLLEDDDEMTERVDSSMDLEGQERQWALAIKAAVEASSELDNLTDMEYGQHAIIAQGNLAKALKRIEGLQWCRKEFGIDNTADQGYYFLEETSKLHMGSLLTIDTCPITGEGILGWDLGACFPQVAFECHPNDTVMERNWKIHAGGCYYVLHAVQPSFAAIREGTFCLVDGHNMSWGNISMMYQRRLHDEVWTHYPFKVKKIMEYNTNSIAAAFWSLMKPLIPKCIRNVMELGCQVEFVDSKAAPRTLRELYLQPSVEESTFHMLKRAHQLLTLRARNEASFRL
ncbi:expressed unknown protein [Seminavis robusta]|uniref:CRAL-TRIO domain-containing protein n=1 Tax=Seminavis robusta TaxID=568900 RepID=A0A9N8HYE3_9STRA|nr:expressed unknown protein [Seminavis robusta]|eukprot:Sro3991_g352370.1 n/a (351) ;mRNA; r:878-1930